MRLIAPPSVPPAATRLEVRVPGADMNPYFALAAVFALGLRGIEKRLPLPGPPMALLSVEDKRSGKVGGVLCCRGEAVVLMNCVFVL